MAPLPEFPQALATLLDSVEPVDRQEIGVRESLGRILGRDPAVPRDMPDLPRSAVDGFAMGEPSEPSLEIVAEVAAGGLPDRGLAPGEAAAIMTGAVVPEGADRVVKIEDCRRDGDRLQPPDGTRAGDLINPAGSEARTGDPLAAAGSRIGPTLYPALFCAGLTRVEVHRRVRLGLLVSGDEVREIEDGPAPGQVFNTNRYILEAVCAALGIEVVRTVALPDVFEATAAAMRDLAAECDILVASGGVSRGAHDHVGRFLRDGEFDLLLQGTAIKPGRPLHAARDAGGTLVLGMPGYPAAFLTNAFLYLVPVLKKLAGRSRFATRWFPVTLADPQRGRAGRTTLNRVRLHHDQGRWMAVDSGSQRPSHFLDIARCDGLVRMPDSLASGRDREPFTLPRGAELPALHFGWELA